MPQRQEVTNVLLADLLNEHGLAAEPEQVLTSRRRGTQMPDVLVDLMGLRLAIEAEVSHG
jgi:hypothetical protein